VVGDQYHNNVELFSPNGKCQFNLSSIPNLDRFILPTLANFDDKILACPLLTSDTGNCWQYNIAENNWIPFMEFNKTEVDGDIDEQNRRRFGVVHNSKMYVYETSNSEVYDPKTNSWSKWIEPKEPIEKAPCFISWKDSILLIGGRENEIDVQIFNSTLNSWSLLGAKPSPFTLLSPGAKLTNILKAAFLYETILSHLFSNYSLALKLFGKSILMQLKLL
jgi:hypothetical protein